MPASPAASVDRVLQEPEIAAALTAERAAVGSAFDCEHRFVIDKPWSAVTSDFVNVAVRASQRGRRLAWLWLSDEMEAVSRRP